MVRPDRVELPTFWFVARRSIQLSYGRMFSTTCGLYQTLLTVWLMERFEEFLNERKYLLNVSHKTLVYYNCAFQSWRKHGGGDPRGSPQNRPVGVTSKPASSWTIIQDKN